jgi:C4-dicarboxylate transporter DctM subunit
MIQYIVLLFIFTVLFGLPLFFAFGFAASMACWVADLPLEAIAQQMMIGMDSFALLAIPGFILVGDIMCQGGIARRAVDFCVALIGHLRGGLSMVAVMVGMIMGGISGSAVADTAAIASTMISPMEEEKYPRDFSAAVVATAGPLGNIIPPSIPMIVYSMTSGQSLLDLFLAGYIPGVMIGLGLMGYCYFTSRKHRYGRTNASLSWQRVVVTFKRSFLAILTPVFIVGGIVSGIFTPTEASMMGVVYCIVVAILVYKELRWRDMPAILLKSAKATAKLTIIIAIGSVFSYICISEGVPDMVKRFILSISDDRMVILLMLNVFLLFLGCILDILVATVILVPVLVPLADAAGINQLHLAMLFVINMSIGLLTPPVGYSLFVASTVSKVPVEKIAVRELPIVATMIVILIFVIFCPKLSLYMPSLVH